MSRYGELTPATILQIAWEAKDGKVDPDDARRLLEHFCTCNDEKEMRELIQHLRDAFKSYLSNEKKLEAALGLARKRGRPARDENMRQEMALEVLRLRMENIAHQECVQQISESYGWSATIVGEAWRDNKHFALMLMRLERALDQYPWMPSEIQRLGEIYADEEWFAPGKPEIKPE